MRSLIIFAILFFFCLATTTSGHSPLEETFQNLTGCQHGESRTGLVSVKRYMSKYGYLGNYEKYDDVFDGGLETALLKYQKFFRLKPTGILDAATVEEMKKPRCGVADSGDTNNTFHGRNLYSFPSNNPIWSVGRRNLKYYFDSSGTTISTFVLRAVYARAFSRWQSVTLVTFREVSFLSQADIVIQFLEGDHGDGYPFDGQLGPTLAHAFFPMDGRLHFDGEEFWTAALGNTASPDLYTYTDAFDLESVAVHEIGHILGLGHSNVANAVMYPTIASQTRKVALSADDIAGVRRLYGTRF